MLVDVFENLYRKIDELDPAKFLSAPGLIWQAALKKSIVKWDFLTHADMLLIVGKGITWGIFHSVCECAKANNTYMKCYDKNKESAYIQYWDINNLYG